MGFTCWFWDFLLLFWLAGWLRRGEEEIEVKQTYQTPISFHTDVFQVCNNKGY